MLDLFIQQTANGIAQGTSYALIALGLTTVFGVLHIINFAHGEIYMIGGLAAVIATTAFGAPYSLALCAAVVSAALIAWVVDLAGVGTVLDKRDGPSTVLLTTFAISILINQSVLATWGPSPVRIDGIPGFTQWGAATVSNQSLFLIAVGAVSLVLIEFLLRRTAIGKNIRAVADSAFASQVIGINVKQVRTVTFIGAGALAGADGCAHGSHHTFYPRHWSQRHHQCIRGCCCGRHG